MIWSHKQDAVLREIVESASVLATWDVIANKVSHALGQRVTEDMARNRAKRIGAERFVPVAPAEPQPLLTCGTPAISEEAKAKVIESDLRRKANAGVRDVARFENLLDVIADVVPKLPAPKVDEKALEERSRGEQDMVLVISDSHYGQLVDPEVVGQGWDYSSIVFESYLHELRARAKRIFEIQDQVDKIRRIHVFFLGDMVDGVDMRRGQSHRNDINSAVKQAFGVAGWFADFVAWLSYYAPVTVHCAYGNHGRVGEFGVNLPMDNWDYVAYHAIQSALPNYEGIVDFVIPTEKYGIEEILGRNIYYAHGDAIGGKGSTSKSIKAYVASLQNLHHQVFDIALFGHFHNGEEYAAGNTRIFMNGSWPGGDDYSINQLGLATPPRQWAFGLSESRGVTWTYQLELAPPREATPPTRSIYE